MTRVLALCIAASHIACFCATLTAQTLFFDDFENGVGGDIVWAPWGNMSGDPTTPNGFNNLVTTDTSHALSGTRSARAWEADPAHWNGFADFGVTADGLRATIYLFEDMTYVPPYLDQPAWKQPYIEVRSMFTLFGDSAGGPSETDPNSDYLQIRLIPDARRPEDPMPSLYTYGIRTKYRDDNGLGILDTGVPRKDSDWLKLTIEVDSVADGGEVRFFIDDVPVGTSQRTGADLRWVMMGATGPTYENYWHDDISVVDLDGEYGDYWHGDFNGDGITDAADYVMWRKSVPDSAIAFTTWKRHFGFGSEIAESVVIPEPESYAALAIFGCLLLVGRHPPCRIQLLGERRADTIRQDDRRG